jgi:phosphodiesterase/alkaline phosphatase D-like protein
VKRKVAALFDKTVVAALAVTGTMTALTAATILNPSSAVLAADFTATTERIAPKPNWKPLPSSETPLERIGFGSCLHQDHPQPIWSAIIAAKPQLFLMIGDNVYGDVKSPDLRELSAAYKKQAAQAEFAAARGRFPFLAIWDDHDFGRNDGGADFPQRKQARKLFNAFWRGSGSVAPADRDGLYYAKSFGPPGRRTQIIMLDTRSFRSPLRHRPVGSPGKGKYQPDSDPRKTMLGAEQWSWLGERLKEPADLRLVVSSIQVLADGHNFERWGNLPAERSKLFALIKSTNANGVVFLSGDRHRATIYINPNDGPYTLYEITSSALNLPFADPTETGPFQQGQMFGEANFGTVAVDWRQRTVDLLIHGPGGGPVRKRTINLSQLVAK